MKDPDMDNPNQYVDENTFRWTVGGIFGLGMTAAGILWRRINGIEEKQTGQGDKLASKQHEGDDALWEAVNGLAKDHQAFQVRTLDTFRDVPTKADLQAMENRIMAALRSRAPAE